MGRYYREVTPDTSTYEIFTACITQVCEADSECLWYFSGRQSIHVTVKIPNLLLSKLADHWAAPVLHSRGQSLQLIFWFVVTETSLL